MSNSDIRVVPGPANYFSHPGSLERLSDFFSADQLSRAVWVYGERALAGAEPFLPAAFHLPEAKKILFTGHCSERDVARCSTARKCWPAAWGYRWWPSRLSPPPARRGRRCRCGIATPDRP